VTFAQIDDHFDDHPKYIGYGAAEMGVLACSLTFSNRHLTDGVIPKAWVAQRFGKEGTRAMKAFLDDGIWTEKDPKHCLIVGFLDHNPSREEVLDWRAKKSEAKIEAGRQGGIRSGEARRSKREAESKQTRSSCLPFALNQTKQNEALSSPLLSTPIRGEESPLPPVEDSNAEWGLDGERASSVQPIANAPQSLDVDLGRAFTTSAIVRVVREVEDVPEAAQEPPAGVTSRQLDYQRAYESGIAQGKGAPYAMPEPQRCELHRAIATFARNRDGVAYRGESVLRWITHTAKEFAQQVRGKEATYYSSFGPRGFVKWLNEAELETGEVDHG
jgi:hypothetical protein